MQLKDINARLERIEPKVNSSDGLASNYPAVETKPASLNPKRSSPKAKNSSREVSLFGGLSVLTQNIADTSWLLTSTYAKVLSQHGPSYFA